MKLAQIRSMDISDGEGIGVAIYTQGCSQHCKGCHNPETWSMEDGFEYTEEYKQILLDLINSPHINHFSILGGEPFLSRNLDDLTKLCKDIKTLYPNKKIWCWTGYHWNDIYQKQELQELFQYIDILVTEPFEIDKRDITLKWRGSSNQMVIDLQKTIEQDKLILYCE